MKTLAVERLGEVPYRESEVLQRDYWRRRLEGRIGDTLLLLEHPPVITLGLRKQSAGDVLLAREELERRGIQLVQTDRGGLATLHCPGQLVGYVFVKPAEFNGGLRALIHAIETGLVQVCARFGLPAEAGRRGEPGVWIGERKVASLGLAIRRGVSRHGFALNVCNDLSLFAALRPCGYVASVMTSLTRESGRKIATREALAALEAVFPDLLAAIRREKSAG